MMLSLRRSMRRCFRRFDATLSLDDAADATA